MTPYIFQTSVLLELVAIAVAAYVLRLRVDRRQISTQAVPVKVPEGK